MAVKSKVKAGCYILAPLINCKNSLDIANKLLLYRQVLRPLLPYTVGVWFDVPVEQARGVPESSFVIRCDLLGTRTSAGTWVF